MATANSPFATRVETRHGRALTPQEIFEITSARERSLSRLLMLYVATGLAFMLLPGTFLGVWNLIRISTRAAAGAVSASWIQAHGHAQFFGWIGTFILGIGFYSIPKLRRTDDFGLWIARTTWALWTGGVALRWLTNVYQWHWRSMLPLSAALQLAAFALFFHSVAGHRPSASGRKPAFELWARIVVGATAGMALSLAVNLGGGAWVAWTGPNPAFPPAFDVKFLTLTAWGFVVPFVWGFSTKWLPVFLGLRETRARLLAGAAMAQIVAVTSALLGFYRLASFLLLATSMAVPIALRLFESTRQPAKLNGVHRSLPAFVRMAYVWAVIGAVLGLWAAYTSNANGLAGAGRHALTVGFIATMVFCVGQRVLPAFAGMRLLWSPRLMFAALACLATGCLLRVLSEVLAYQDYYARAWRWLPVSAVIELTAVTLFAVNIVMTMLSAPPSSQLVQVKPRA